MKPTKISRRYGRKTTKEFAVRMSPGEYKRVKQELKKFPGTHRQWLLKQLDIQ